MQTNKYVWGLAPATSFKSVDLLLSKDSNCNYFTHGKLDLYCYLKKGNGTLFDDPLSISGPKDCSVMLSGTREDFYTFGMLKKTFNISLSCPIFDQSFKMGFQFAMQTSP